jgi:hypothetical protein
LGLSRPERHDDHVDHDDHHHHTAGDDGTADHSGATAGDDHDIDEYHHVDDRGAHHDGCCLEHDRRTLRRSVAVATTAVQPSSNA